MFNQMMAFEKNTATRSLVLLCAATVHNPITSTRMNNKSICVVSGENSMKPAQGGPR